MIINAIKRHSKLLFSDLKIKEATNHFDKAIQSTFEKIVNECPEFCSKFIKEDLKDVSGFEELNH